MKVIRLGAIGFVSFEGVGWVMAEETAGAVVLAEPSPWMLYLAGAFAGFSPAFQECAAGLAELVRLNRCGRNSSDEYDDVCERMGLTWRKMSGAEEGLLTLMLVAEYMGGSGL